MNTMKVKTIKVYECSKCGEELQLPEQYVVVDLHEKPMREKLQEQRQRLAQKKELRKTRKKRFFDPQKTHAVQQAVLKALVRLGEATTVRIQEETGLMPLQVNNALHSLCDAKKPRIRRRRLYPTQEEFKHLKLTPRQAVAALCIHGYVILYSAIAEVRKNG